jgi:Ca2+:H+ antiporter
VLSTSLTPFLNCRVALGSSVQIALFVLPVTVIVGWFTGKEMTMRFPLFEVSLYLMSVFIVAICLSNARSNWLEGSLFVSMYALVAVGIYFEKDVIKPHQ